VLHNVEVFSRNALYKFTFYITLHKQSWLGLRNHTPRSWQIIPGYFIRGYFLFVFKKYFTYLSKMVKTVNTPPGYLLVLPFLRNYLVIYFCPIGKYLFTFSLEFLRDPKLGPKTLSPPV